MLSSRRISRSLLRSSRAFSTGAQKEADFTHAVVGAGVVGLAIARRLQARDGVSTVLIEKHGSVGTETSSRNSEVIHAGLYYGKDTLKTKLCLQGKQLMYELCQKHRIPHRNTGKWITAQNDQQLEAIQKVHDFASTIGVPTRFIPEDEAKRREPDVHAGAGILESPSTGIVDSHGLMQYLEGDFENNEGICAFNSAVSTITPLNGGKDGWEITTSSPDGEQTTISAETLINAAGLSAIPVSNMILPPERHLKPYFAKGTYFSYSLSSPRPSVLVYPAPTPGLGGLGTHLTLDMSGRVRFGPDVEWVDDPNDYTPNPKNLEAALKDITAYLPGVDTSALALDYAGIRPKLASAGSVTSGKAFNDFYICKEEGFEGFVNLLGIESPGLTASLAIAEEVESLLY